MESAVKGHVRAIMVSTLAWVLASVASADTGSAWVLWVTSEIKPWYRTFTYGDLLECERGIHSYIKASEGHWGAKGDLNGLWSPVATGRAWGVVEYKDGSKRRIELLCLPETAVPRPGTEGHR